MESSKTRTHKWYGLVAVNEKTQGGPVLVKGVIRFLLKCVYSLHWWIVEFSFLILSRARTEIMTCLDSDVARRDMGNIDRCRRNKIEND